MNIIHRLCHLDIHVLSFAEQVMDVLYHFIEHDGII